MSDADQNRVYWDLSSAEYDGKIGDFIADGWAWGVWAIPEDELGVFDGVELEGADVLELGCGAAEWSRAMARRGARPVGLDNSPARLERAREEIGAAGLEIPLIQAAAEQIPLEDGSFDIVFCDWGATNFADPYLVVPEVSRVLRPDGLFAFNGAAPLSWMCWNEETDDTERTLYRDYFGMHRWETPEGSVEYNLPHGEWIRLFRANGLTIEDLVELRSPEGVESPYRSQSEAAWARRWPMEQIWKLRKA